MELRYRRRAEAVARDVGTLCTKVGRKCVTSRAGQPLGVPAWGVRWRRESPGRRRGQVSREGGQAAGCTPSEKSMSRRGVMVSII